MQLQRYARLLVVMLVLVGVGLATTSPTAADTTPPPATAGRFIVRGLTDPDPDLLARSLAADEELLLLSSPLTTRKALLAAVASKTMLTLQHQGFPAPQATATLESGSGSDHGERIVIDVVPGTRQLAAGIEITGLPEPLTEDLRRWLRSQRPAPGAIAVSYDTESGWSGTRWLDPRGQPARMEMPAWSRGHPAAFDAPHLATIRAAIARFLREQGFFAAAKLADKPSAALGSAGWDSAGGSIDVAVRPGDEGAVLSITFATVPPASTLRDIEVAPAGRVSAAVLQEKLGIVLGGPVTERDRVAWRETLRQSGRFVRHEVKFREVKPVDDGVPGVVAIFDLAAYPHVPPLSEPLTREQEAVLRARSWLLETLANDDDLIVTWTRPSTTAGPMQPTGSLVISTHEGLLLTALPGGDDACGMAVSGGGLGWFLPRAAGWFEVPLPVRTRLDIDVTVDLRETVDQGRHDYRRELHAGCSLEPRPRDAMAAVALAARIEPVACLSVLYEGSPTLRWEDDQLVVAGPMLAARIDAATGRLVSVSLPDGGHVAFDAAAGRFAGDLAALRAAAGADLTQPEALVSSGVAFFTGDAMGAASRRLLEAVDLSALAAPWQERIASIADTLRRTSESGGFATADRAADAALDRLAAADSTPLLTIPATAAPDATSSMVMARLAATHAWRWMERTCGRDTWPAALARVATLAARHDAGVLWELSAFLSAKQYGPVAYLAASSAAPLPAMAASLARQGQSRLTADAFHADCLAVLAILQGCGLDCCCVSLLRTIDDAEAEQLGETWLRDRGSLVPLVHELRGCASDAAALAALPEALDRWWTASLQKVVASALASRADIQTADKPSSDPTAVR
jgi:hypothetical protein